MKEDDNIPAKDFINGPLHGIYKNGEWEFPTCSKKINPISSKRKKDWVKMYNISISKLVANLEDDK